MTRLARPDGSSRHVTSTELRSSEWRGSLDLTCVRHLDRARSASGEVERHLRHEPDRTSKSRIKRLRGLSHPQYRLRVDDIRVFYDITEETVEVLAIVSKAEAQDWLDAEGASDEADRAGEGEG